MKKLTFLFAAVLLAVASTVSAQTACPSGTSGATVKSNTQFSFFWCAQPNPTITGAFVFGLPSGKQLLTNLRVVAGPFTDGMVQMQAEVLTGVAKGQYTVTVSQTAVDINLGGVVESGPSVPFALSAADPMVLPAPKNLRVQ